MTLITSRVTDNLRIGAGPQLQARRFGTPCIAASRPNTMRLEPSETRNQIYLAWYHISNPNQGGILSP